MQSFILHASVYANKEECIKCMHSTQLFKVSQLNFEPELHPGRCVLYRVCEGQETRDLEWRTWHRFGIVQALNNLFGEVRDLFR